MRAQPPAALVWVDADDFLGRVARTVPIQDKYDHLYGTIDLAADGTLLGIEILGVRKLLPSTNT